MKQITTGTGIKLRSEVIGNKCKSLGDQMRKYTTIGNKIKRPTSPTFTLRSAKSGRGKRDPVQGVGKSTVWGGPAERLGKGLEDDGE